MSSETTRCNMCGKLIHVWDGKETEDYLKVEKKWGYFSEKDGITHRFCICEDCYKQWISSFQIPVMDEETTELL